MDDTLRLIQSLYGEEVDDPTFARRVTEDDELRREYEQLQETKQALDRRSPPSPDPAVVDQIVDRAADAAQPATERPERAPDRTAQAPDREWTRRLRRVSAALAVVLLIGLGWWQLRLDDPATTNTVGSNPAAQSPQSMTAGTEQVQDSPEDMPEWDDRDEVVQLHRRIELLRTRSRSDAWGADLQTVDQPRP